jgi:catechol 2,3-dioxygenase-like lactoylglutathione lyase family enzyme
MIIGTHTLIYSPDPARDREFLRDVLDFPHVDAGDGWLIFGVPPAEMGVHPVHGDRLWEVCFMTDDVEAEVDRLQESGCTFTPIVDQGYGLVTRMTLPGGAQLDLYEPKHEMAITPRAGAGD